MKLQILKYAEQCLHNRHAKHIAVIISKIAVGTNVPQGISLAPSSLTSLVLSIFVYTLEFFVQISLCPLFGSCTLWKTVSCIPVYSSDEQCGGRSALQSNKNLSSLKGYGEVERGSSGECLHMGRRKINKLVLDVGIISNLFTRYYMGNLEGEHNERQFKAILQRTQLSGQGLYGTLPLL